MKRLETLDVIVIVLTIAFVALYILALTGVVKGPADDRLLGHLDPIIGVIIGYFFGRAPSIVTEKHLHERLAAVEAARDAALTRLADVKPKNG